MPITLEYYFSVSCSQKMPDDDALRIWNINVVQTYLPCVPIDVMLINVDCILQFSSSGKGQRQSRGGGLKQKQQCFQCAFQKKANTETSTFNSLRLLPDEEDKYILVCVTLRRTVKIELVLNYFETMPLLFHPPKEVLNLMGTSVSKSTSAP